MIFDTELFKRWKVNYLHTIGLSVVLVGAFLFCAYQLTESPLTWKDEGIIVQVARNVAEQGRFAVQTAPGTFVSAGFVTTGFPVVYPIAVLFRLFGSTLLVARSGMTVFILGLLVASYLLVSGIADRKKALWGIALMASFAPLYGNGKNVLGEVPGIFYFVTGLFLLSYAERVMGWRGAMWVAATGLAFGLSMATKPLYLIVLVPVLLVLVVIAIWRKTFSVGEVLVLAGAVLAPILLWIATQFTGDSLASILSIYSGNPEGGSLATLLASNAKRFITELQPIYFAGLLVIWSLAVFFRKKVGESIALAEIGALLFSLLVGVAFLKSVGYYRYFFPAQVVALLFFPYTLSVVAEGVLYRLRLDRTASCVNIGLIVLVMFQVYTTLFNSWVNIDYHGARTGQLERYFASVPATTSIYVYNVPEATFFIQDNPYFQYLRFASTIERGIETQKLITTATPDLVVVTGDEWKADPLFARYEQKDLVDHYFMLARKIQ